MAPPPREKPVQAFEKLRQCFDVIKSNHVDPWTWHEYLSAEPQDDTDSDDDDDPELMALRPKKRKNVDRLKTHLLACVAELNRAAQAADLCYFHMCCTPKEMRDCVMILGTSGDIDVELLQASGDASPAKILAALQAKLDVIRERVSELEDDVADLQGRLADSEVSTKASFIQWQSAAMAAEEAATRMNDMKAVVAEARVREEALQAAFDDLYPRLVRASRLMLYKGRQMLRDSIFKVNKKETAFYAFQGFIYVLKMEKEERIRREQEEQRNAVEFALRNEVRFLTVEMSRRTGTAERLTVEAGRLKRDRRELACRILYKHRPYEPLEYCLWLWELWQPIRKELALEKYLETEKAARAAIAQQLTHTSALLPPLATRIEVLRIDLASEKLAHDVSRKQIVAAGARQIAALVERLRGQRVQELAVYERLHRLDVEAKEERIAVLERELAEDTHIRALKGMVVDLEGNLRRALDKRKQRAFVVPPAGQKCVQCQRDMLFRNWRCTPMQGMSHSIADVDLTQGVSASALSQLASMASKASLSDMGSSRGLGQGLGQGLGSGFGLSGESVGGGKPSPPWGEKKATYAAVWR